MAEKVREKGYVFSSANSINFGRLAPQIVYYIYAYARLVRAGEVRMGDEVNITVPTGNFGNILAAYYAEAHGASRGEADLRFQQKQCAHGLFSIPGGM